MLYNGCERQQVSNSVSHGRRTIFSMHGMRRSQSSIHIVPPEQMHGTNECMGLWKGLAHIRLVCSYRQMESAILALQCALLYHVESHDSGYDIDIILR